MSDTDQIRVIDLPNDLQQLEFDSIQTGKPMSLKDQEKIFIHKALEMSNYNTGLTSKMLKIPRTTLWRKMKKYNIGNVNPANHPD